MERIKPKKEDIEQVREALDVTSKPKSETVSVAEVKVGKYKQYRVTIPAKFASTLEIGKRTHEARVKLSPDGSELTIQVFRKDGEEKKAKQ